MTFTRASTGTYVGADGLIKTASADTARFTYDPATGESLGLLVEESRTNLWVNSTSIVSSNPPVYGNWYQASTTANTAVAPDGTTTADTITPGSPTASVIQRFLATAGTTYTFSIYVKRNPGSDNTYLDRFGFVVAWSNNGSTLTGNATLELVPGSSATNVLTDQWKRFSFSYTCPAGAVSMEMGISNRNAGAGSPGYSVLAWGAQVEAGSYATSYIPTSGSAVTRQADKPILLGSSVTSLAQSFSPSNLVSIGTENSTIASSGGGSVVFDGNGDYLVTPSNISIASDFQFGTGDFTVEAWIWKSSNGLNNYDGLISLGKNGSASDGWFLEISSSRGYLWYAAGPSGIGSISYNVSPNTSKWEHICVERYNGVTKMYLNGVVVGTNSNSYTIPTTATSLYVGGYAIGTGNYSFNGYISNLRVVKGRAVYTSNFTPIAPLKSVNGTVLLCCNSAASATAESTGKTLIVNGNASPSTQAPVSLTLDAQASDTNTVSNVLYYPTPLSSATVASMKNAHVPIVKDDLVLHLDAGYSKSYSGTGATWHDLSGKRNNGTLVNGVGYFDDNLGSLSFDGVDDYISSFPIQLSGTGSNTINVWFKVLTTSRTGLCGTRGALVATGWVLTVNRNAAGRLTYFHTGGSELELNAGILTNTWYCATSTYNTSSAIVTLYLNGNQIGSPQSSFSTISASSFNGVIGAEDEQFNTKFNGNIAQVSIYNRALTASEVAQNFNALRNRFGV
jgi:hypothetical protein